MMKPSEAEQIRQPDRRQWLVSCARYALLGGLGLLSGHLLIKSRRPECRRSAACQQCGAWGACRLPLAVETRRKMQG